MSLTVGLRARLNVGIKTDPRTVWAGLSDIASATALSAVMGGATPATHLHKGTEATGSTDRAGSTNLVTVNSPTHGIFNSRFGEDTVRFPEGGPGGKLQAPLTTDMEVGSGSWSFILVGDNYTVSAAGRGLAGKRLDNVSAGWHVQSLTGNAIRVQREGTLGNNRTIDGTNDYGSGPFAILVRNVPGTEFMFRDHLGDSFTGTADNDDVTNTRRYEIGRVGSPGGESYDLGMAALLIGSTWLDAEFDRLVSFLGLR